MAAIVGAIANAVSRTGVRIAISAESARASRGAEGGQASQGIGYWAGSSAGPPLLQQGGWVWQAR